MLRLRHKGHEDDSSGGRTQRRWTRKKIQGMEVGEGVSAAAKKGGGRREGCSPW